MKVWKQLKKLRKAKHRLSNYEGICDNIAYRLKGRQELEDWHKHRVRAIASWGKSTLQPGYPVPSTLPGYGPIAMYSAAVNKWKGSYGKLRKELLEHLIQYFKERNL